MVACLRVSEQSLWAAKTVPGPQLGLSGAGKREQEEQEEGGKGARETEGERKIDEGEKQLERRWGS